MKAIILAAGQGTRLRPLTDELPKCMVPFKGKPIINYIVETMNECGIDDISIVNGYCGDKIDINNVTYYTNNNYESTNMAYSLFCAEDAMDDDCIISYADIIYTPQVLSSLIKVPDNFAVVIDSQWKKLWELRMANPLDDAETLKLDNNGFITELGKKATSYEEIQGQYIGLFKMSKDVVSQFREFYHSLDKNTIYDGKDYNNMYMTSLLQQTIDQLMPVKAVPVNRGWIEVDSIDDLRGYENVEELF